MQCLTALEDDYNSAKLRLQAAQQENLEAAAEFLAARAALRQTLETLWPSPCECSAEHPLALDTRPTFGYDDSVEQCTEKQGAERKFL